LLFKILDCCLPSNRLVMKTVHELFGTAELHLSSFLLSVEVLKDLEGVSVVGLQSVNLVSNGLKFSLLALKISVSNIELTLSLLEHSLLGLNNFLNLSVFIHSNTEHTDGFTSD
jgi:hypothetical protein